MAIGLSFIDQKKTACPEQDQGKRLNTKRGNINLVTDSTYKNFLCLS